MTEEVGIKKRKEKKKIKQPTKKETAGKCLSSILLPV